MVKIREPHDATSSPEPTSSTKSASARLTAGAGLAGNDPLRGGFGGDRMLGGRGNDWAFGGNGADRIDGGADDDVLKGEASDDELTGGTGVDLLEGNGGIGGGADAPRFKPHDGGDRIRDWEPGEDRIDVRAFGLASRAEVLARAEQVGDDVVLDLTEERLQVTLLDAELDEVRGSDFII